MRHESVDVISALRDRQSIRSYKDRPVRSETIGKILEAAAHSPSGTNTQPWNVYVMSGAVKDELCAEVCEFRDNNPQIEDDREFMGEYRYYPNPITEPYLGRRREIGWQMYEAMGVQRGDRAASWQVAARNYTFFGAPVGLIFTLDRALEKGSWIDLGIFLGSVMLAARHYGLDTCAQGAWARYHKFVRRHLNVPDTEIVVCGMALGYADMGSAANTVRARKLRVEEFAKFFLDKGAGKDCEPVPE